MSLRKETKSIWMATQVMPKFPSLASELDVDVCIVGGGIAGLTTAYLLMKEGKRVCVLEAYELASGQTGRTTAHFVTALDDRYFDLEKYFGEKGARLAAESHRKAIETVERIVSEEKIDCEMSRVDGYLFQGDSDEDLLESELEACRRASMEVELLAKSPLAFDPGPCLKFANQMELHPLKYLGELSKRIVEGGGQIFTNTHVSEIKGGDAAFVKTDAGHRVTCKSIVVATNTPVCDVVAVHTKQAAYRTYVLGFEIPLGSVPRALYWDTLDPYHYIRLEKGEAPDTEILIVGGEDHKTGQDSNPAERFEVLEKWTRDRFPFVGVVAYRWSGQVMEPVDGLGFLGRNPMDKDNVFIITGDSGNGMTHSTIGALIITDQIMGRKNPWEELYDPSRVTMRASGAFVKENANVAAQYGAWLTGGSTPGFPDLAPGEGTVYRDGLKMVAAYKGASGEVQLMSAACPHLGCVVNWNSVEKSWDCPCHGSRFDCVGKVIEGPAIKDLAPMRESEVGETVKRRAPTDEHVGQKLQRPPEH